MGWNTSTLAASAPVISRSSSVTLSATVTSVGHSALAGVMRFYIGSASGPFLGQAQLRPFSNSASGAELRVPASDLTLGENQVVAYFSGGEGAGPSTSLPVTVRVEE